MGSRPKNGGSGGLNGMNTFSHSDSDNYRTTSAGTRGSNYRINGAPAGSNSAAATAAFANLSNAAPAATAATPAATPAAATPIGTAGPTTTAKMTSYLQKHPVAMPTTTKGTVLKPGINDAGPKLPGMMAGYDSHGNPIPVAAPAVQPRNTLAQLLTSANSWKLDPRDTRGGASHGDRSNSQSGS